MVNASERLLNFVLGTRCSPQDDSILLTLSRKPGIRSFGHIEGTTWSYISKVVLEDVLPGRLGSHESPMIFETHDSGIVHLGWR
jgi:hypothetical protein